MDMSKSGLAMLAAGVVRSIPVRSIATMTLLERERQSVRLVGNHHQMNAV
jgi:hypothetical protein